MKTFHNHRARIPTSLFKDIVADLEVTMKQYGEPVQHENEEARSTFLAPVSDSFWPMTFSEMMGLKFAVGTVTEAASKPSGGGGDNHRRIFY